MEFIKPTKDKIILMIIIALVLIMIEFVWSLFWGVSHTSLGVMCPHYVISTDGSLVTPTPVPTKTLHDYWFTNPDPYCGGVSRIDQLVGTSILLLFLPFCYLISCTLIFYTAKLNQRQKEKIKLKH